MSFPFFTIILLLAKEFASIEELHASQFSNIDLVLLVLHSRYLHSSLANNRHPLPIQLLRLFVQMIQAVLSCYLRVFFAGN